MEPILNINQIMRKLPHRYPFLLVDRVVKLTKNVDICAYKNVSMNEPFFQGHFPNYPVMPGVLILEALAQTSALLSFSSADRDIASDEVYYFVGIDNARFKKPVFPGDRLVLESRLDRIRSSIYRFNCCASVDDRLCASADIMCTIRKLEQ